MNACLGIDNLQSVRIPGDRAAWVMPADIDMSYGWALPYSQAHAGIGDTLLNGLFLREEHLVDTFEGKNGTFGGEPAGNIILGVFGEESPFSEVLVPPGGVYGALNAPTPPPNPVLVADTIDLGHPPDEGLLLLGQDQVTPVCPYDGWIYA